MFSSGKMKYIGIAVIAVTLVQFGFGEDVQVQTDSSQSLTLCKFILMDRIGCWCTKDLLLFSDMKLFKHKRQDQLKAVKSVMKISDFQKQTKMVDKLVTAMIQVLKKSKAEVESSGFVPGMPFPEDENVRNCEKVR